MKLGFNNQAYIEEQSKKIAQRVEQFGGKLYLEFGGKLFDDYHAARVLPGFDLNGKVKLLSKMKDHSEIILCISANAIESNKVRADIGITYDLDVLRIIDNLRGMDLYIGSIVITQFHEQPAAIAFKNKLEMRGERVYLHRYTKGYPSNVDTIVSDEGYGANPYIETKRPLVVVTAPGPGSGKLATCLSQLYHEYKKGIKAGYAKYETFPIWDIPLNHPVNVAYEAATADLHDVNIIDPFHLEKYGKTVVNYNRDVAVFPVVRTILEKITGEAVYHSPTDMGVNMIGRCITDDEVVREASCQEIIRRYYKMRCAYKQGIAELSSVERIEYLMKGQGIRPENRPPVAPALQKAKDSCTSAIALELEDGTMVTGKSSALMNDTASVLLNAIKVLAGLSDEMLLISPIVLEPIIQLKKDMLGSRYPVLNAEEVLIALSISAAFNPSAELALSQLPLLNGTQAHSSDIITQADSSTFRKLGIDITCEPVFPTKNLYFR